MSSNTQKKKTLSNPQISPTHFSQNILIENELNAIGKLPPDLADRAMALLEKSANARIENDKAMIDLEKQNIELQELGFAISQNGELLHKTFYDIKTLSKLFL